MMLKHKLDMEKLQTKTAEPGQIIDVEGGSIPYNTDDIAKLLKTISDDEI